VFSIGELKASIVKFKDLKTDEVSAKFNRPSGRDRRYFLVRENFDPFATMFTQCFTQCSMFLSKRGTSQL
jgi:hypothetical protein